MYKISFLLVTLILVGCSTLSVSMPPSSQPKTIPTFTPAPTDMSSHSPAPSTSAESTPGPCYQSARTQLELNQCAGENTQAAYTKLNSLIAELRGNMDSSQYTMLLKIEADWEEAIAEHCNWEANFFAGGSIQPMWFAGCLTQQYLDRIDVLRISLCEGHGATGECEESLKYKR